MEISNDTHISNITISGVSFIEYRHWSYDGNIGIYINLDMKVGEIVNGEIVYDELDGAAIARIEVMHPEHFAAIFSEEEVKLFPIILNTSWGQQINRNIAAPTEELAISEGKKIEATLTQMTEEEFNEYMNKKGN